MKEIRAVFLCPRAFEARELGDVGLNEAVECGAYEGCACMVVRPARRAGFGACCTDIARSKSDVDPVDIEVDGTLGDLLARLDGAA